MTKTDSLSNLARGNAFFRKGNLVHAIAAYVTSLLEDDYLIARLAGENLRRVQKEYARQRKLFAKPSVSVCGWELSHNAAGRVYCLAEMYQRFADARIVGYHFSGYGTELWEPIRNTEIPTNTIRINEDTTAESFIDSSLRLVIQTPCDIAHISKPRAPGIFLGVLYKLVWGAKVIVDVDDEETAFAGETEAHPLDKSRLYKLPHPTFGHFDQLAWTRISIALADSFDAVTAANRALQRRYGGHIIRHARNEALYHPSNDLKFSSRKILKIPENKIVFIFIGTPRAHKGLQATAKALATLCRDDLLLVVAGDFDDKDLKKTLRQVYPAILFLGNFPFEDTPKLVSAGDFCVLLQDPQSLVSQFQTPAKLSDALGMGIAVLGSPSEGLNEFSESGALHTVTDSTLAYSIDLLIKKTALSAQLRKDGRAFFMKELTISVNSARIENIIREFSDRSFVVNNSAMDFLDLFCQQSTKARQALSILAGKD